MSLAAGVRLNNRFTLRELIGTGGMSWVWRADDQVLGRPVAVKVLTGALATDPTLRTATWTEARAAARLNHPNVTQVYDYGETSLPDGSLLPYLVMELVDGETLADRLRYGPLPWQQAAGVASQVASALAAAHRIGVVHRDIKPGNVMLTRSGVKVLDFGIAALAGGHAAADAERLLGTPAYAAPERLRPGTATPAGDVYALGALFYEALTGHPPIAAGNWDQAAAAHFGAAPVDPPDAPGLPRQLRRLCAECLSPDPAQRPTAEEMEEGLALSVGAATGPAPGATAVLTAPAASTVVMPAPTMAAGMPTGYGTPPVGGSYGAAPVGRQYGGSPLGGQPTQVGHPTGAAGPANAALGWARRQPRWLLVLLGAAIAVILVALISLITTSTRPNQLQTLAQPSSPAAADTAAPAGASTSAEPTPSETTPSPVPIMTKPRSIADQLDAVVNNAVAAGRMNGDVGNNLREKINELRASLDRDKGTRKAARDLRQTIEELRSNEDIDRQTANLLLAVLQPLGGGGGD